MQTSLVERTFENISFLRSSMNRTFAATWNITETRSVIVRLSTGPKPKPSTLVSPRTGINFFKLDGLSFLSLSNSYEHEKDSSRQRTHVYSLYVYNYLLLHASNTNINSFRFLTNRQLEHFLQSIVDRQSGFWSHQYEYLSNIGTGSQQFLDQHFSQKPSATSHENIPASVKRGYRGTFLRPDLSIDVCLKPIVFPETYDPFLLIYLL